MLPDKVGLAIRFVDLVLNCIGDVQGVRNMEELCRRSPKIKRRAKWSIKVQTKCTRRSWRLEVCFAIVQPSHEHPTKCLLLKIATKCAFQMHPTAMNNNQMQHSSYIINRRFEAIDNDQSIEWGACACKLIRSRYFRSPPTYYLNRSHFSVLHVHYKIAHLRRVAVHRSCVALDRRKDGNKHASESQLIESHLENGIAYHQCRQNEQFIEFPVGMGTKDRWM